MQVDQVLRSGATPRSRLGDPSTWAELCPLPPAEAAACIARSCAGHYVYVLVDGEGVPLYVGKGQGRRCFDHAAEQRGPPPRLRSHKYNAIAKLLASGMEPNVALPAFYPDAAPALAEEMRLIALYGRYYPGPDGRRGPLTNQTAGGEGGLDPSPEALALRATTLWGPSGDPERHAAWEFVNALDGSIRSNFLKPLDAFRRKLKPTQARLGGSGDLSVRSATLVVAMALAAGRTLDAGTEIPRAVEVSGIQMVVENGAMRDIVAALMADIRMPRPGDPALEVAILRHNARSAALRHFGADRLVSLGVLAP